MDWFYYRKFSKGQVSKDRLSWISFEKESGDRDMTKLVFVLTILYNRIVKLIGIFVAHSHDF